MVVPSIITDIDISFGFETYIDIEDFYSYLEYFTYNYKSIYGGGTISTSYDIYALIEYLKL